MKHFKKLYSIYSDIPAVQSFKKSKDTSGTFFSNFYKIIITIAVVLCLSWGITIATTDDLASATENFSVIGVVSEITNNTISLVDARGTHATDSTITDLNISYIEKIQTKEYNPLIISDIVVGDTVIIQGVTNSKDFFAKRIISFSKIAYKDIATTTPEVIATTTEQLSTTTDQVDVENKEVDTMGSDTSLENVEPQIVDIASSTQKEIEDAVQATSTIDQPVEDSMASTSDSMEQNTASSTIIDTVTDIIDSGIETVTDTLDIIIDTITGQGEQTEMEIQETIPPVSE